MSKPIIIGEQDRKFEEMAMQAEAEQAQAQVIGSLIQASVENTMDVILNTGVAFIYYDENGKHVTPEESPGIEFKRQNPTDSGYDIASPIDFVLQPNERRIVNTCVGVMMPSYVDAFILPRSGNAANFGIMVVNSPGLIDSSFLNPISVILFNAGSEPWEVKRGTRIAQIRFQPKGMNLKTMTFNGNLNEIKEKMNARKGGLGSTN